MLTGEHGVGRVIARPFVGNKKGEFKRTPRRHDFSLKPLKDTVLDYIKNSGMTVYGVGKINDIFANKGISEYVYTVSNKDGMDKTIEAMGPSITSINLKV
jgi:phosphopentomutase